MSNKLRKFLRQTAIPELPVPSYKESHFKLQTIEALNSIASDIDETNKNSINCRNANKAFRMDEKGRIIKPAENDSNIELEAIPSSISVVTKEKISEPKVFDREEVRRAWANFENRPSVIDTNNLVDTINEVISNS